MKFPNHKSNAINKLDPWRIILACVFELDSQDIPLIIDMSGMIVDWQLTEQEGYSHKYRKSAYRPRINKAYETLDGEDRLRVNFIISKELAHRGLADELNTKLKQIGWRCDNGTLSPTTEAVQELFFPQDSQHDAYVYIKEIIRYAKRSLQIIDPYLDGTVFIIIQGIEVPLSVELLTAKIPDDFAFEVSKFRQQHPHLQIEIRRSTDFHDRFIIIDEKSCWHIGCSIKDAGNKAFMISAIEDSWNIEALLNTLRSTWQDATHFA